MPDTFALYDDATLPAGFRYPDEIRAVANGKQTPPIGDWWFVDASTRAGDLFWSIRKEDGRNLVPFAKMDEDIACFDGDDHSGDPKVLALVLDKSGRAYGFESFLSWLAAARSASSC